MSGKPVVKPKPSRKSFNNKGQSGQLAFGTLSNSHRSRKKARESACPPQPSRAPEPASDSDDSGSERVSKAKSIPKENTADTLHYSGKDLVDLSSVVASLAHKKLFLNDNKLTRLVGVEKVPNVTMLQAQNNRLTGEALLDLDPLTRLVVLNLAYNSIVDVPAAALKHADSLKALMLNHNKIASLSTMRQLPGLTTLVLTSNRLSSLPSLHGFENLTKLSLSHNNFAVFPAVYACPNLAELRLNDNKIKVVPKDIAANLQLRVLDIGNNLIEQWKDVRSLRLLPRLVNLNMKGNPLMRTEDYADECVSRFPHLFIMDGVRRSEKPPPHPLALALKTGGVLDAEDGDNLAAPAPDVTDKHATSKRGHEKGSLEAVADAEPPQDNKREKKRPRNPVPILTPAEPSDDEDERFQVPTSRSVSASGVISVTVPDSGVADDDAVTLHVAAPEAAVVIPAKAAKKSKRKGTEKSSVDIAATLRTAVPVIGQGVSSGWD